MKTSALVRVVLAVNTLGLLGYLVWLAVRDEKIFYAQDGILYLLPCIPFIFVFAFVVNARRRDRESAEEES